MRTEGFATVLAAIAIAVLAHAPEAVAQPTCKGSHWVGAWGTSPTDGRQEGFRDQTLRMIVTPSHGGSRTRVKLTNRFGDRPVKFESVHVALRQSGAEVVPGSGRRLAFRGRREVTIKPGASIVSDPVDLRFAAFQDLAVSMYVAGATGPATEHPIAQQTSFVSAPGEGDHAADEAPEAFSATTRAWFFVEAVEVLAPRRIGAVVTLGDSITDGLQPGAGSFGGIDRNERYPDFLARRLLRARGPYGSSVLNAGISGNRVLRDRLAYREGRSALARIKADVLASAGVTDVIVLEGINDLRRTPRATPDRLIAGLKRLVRRLRGAGLNVLLGTLTPAGKTRSSMASLDRKRVNKWIRESGIPVVDFDVAVRDPAHSWQLRPAYDGGDHLHPSPAGYRAMAHAVDLQALRGPRCGGGRGTGLVVRARPGRGARPPYSLRIGGRLRPAGGGACPSALVRLRVASGRRRVASRSARLRRDCHFTLEVVIGGDRAPSVLRRLRVHARFNGTRTLRPATARTAVNLPGV